MCKFPIFLPFIISFVYHYVQVLLLFTFHYMFSVPLSASSPSFYIPLYLQCPIVGKFPIYLHSIRSSVSHSGQVPNNFVLHYIFSVPLCASSLSFYLSLYVQCPILGKFPIYLHSIRSSVSHFGQVPYLFTFHYIFSVPFGASSLSIYIPLDLQCPIMCKFPIYLHFIISSVSHYGQVPYLFTFHYIFSVPLCASSPSFYISLYLQCPIMCKFPNFLCFVISSVSHSGQVPNNFVLHYIFSVPLCASSLSFYISLYIQCPILGKFPIYLHFIRSSVSHFGQVPYLFTFHYIFSVPLCASSLSFYISLYLQCPIMCKFPNFLCFVISSVSHSGQVPYSFTFHYIFSVPLCASSPYFYISFYIQCPILCKFPNFLCFVISSVSHSGQVPNNFTCFIIYLVSHYVQVPYHFYPFGQLPILLYFSVPLCASSLSFYLSLFPLCTIMCKFSFFLPFIICSVSHYVQVLHLFTFHYIFSVPFWASTLSIYISLYLQCPILGKFPIHIFTFHSYVSLYLQCPILCKFPTFLICSVIMFLHYIFSVPFWASSLQYLHFIISSVSHYVQVLHIFTFIFSVPLSIFMCPILGKYPIILCFIIYLVSHYVQVPYLFTFHYFLCVPLCASSPSFYLSLYLQCPILGKYPIALRFIIS